MAGLSKNGSFNIGLNPHLQDREDYFSSQTVKDLNTYSTWDEMLVYNDITTVQYERGKDGKVHEVTNLNSKTGYGIKSIFNKWTLVPVLDTETRVKLNTPLIDTSGTRKRIREKSDPSIKNLVEQSRIGTLGRETYDYSDFMYCKYLGRVSNNYLVTLRRFPIAVNDYIGQIDSSNEEREIATSLGCMVTWMGTPGNDMSDILSYSMKMPFKEMDAKIEDVTRSDNSTPLGSMFAAFDSKYQEQVMKGQAGVQMEPFITKLGLPYASPPYQDQLTHRDSNKIYGPVDVVKKTSMRSEDGLDFQHEFNLQFEYELRSYSNINTRQAMLDLLANILTVTYVNGSFWGGGYRGFGTHQSDLFSNLKIMNNESGGVSGFIDAFADDVNTVGSSIKSSLKGKDILDTLKNIANNFGGMLLGGMLNKLGRPQKTMVNSLLSPAPVGLWHVTVGNPFHPIMSIGNLILEEAKVTHQGPLGLDDFPTKLVVTCRLKRAKGRDAKDIEMLYNQGVVRVYSGLEQHTIDLIKKAPTYKSKDSSKHEYVNSEMVDNPSKTLMYTGKTPRTPNVNLSSFDAMTRYWQTHDQSAIKLAGQEWLRGGASKTKPAKTGQYVGGADSNSKK